MADTLDAVNTRNAAILAEVLPMIGPYNYDDVMRCMRAAALAENTRCRAIVIQTFNATPLPVFVPYTEASADAPMSLMSEDPPPETGPWRDVLVTAGMLYDAFTAPQPDMTPAQTIRDMALVKLLP